MEECTLRSCVDRFNNRRYLSGHAYLNAKTVLSNPHVLTNAANSNFQVSGPTNMSNQMHLSGGNAGGLNNGSMGNSNTNNCSNSNNTSQVIQIQCLF